MQHKGNTKSKQFVSICLIGLNLNAPSGMEQKSMIQRPQQASQGRSQRGLCDNTEASLRMRKRQETDEAYSQIQRSPIANSQNAMPH